MRNNTKNGNQRFIPPFGCFPLIPVVFFQTGERPASIHRGSPLRFAAPSPARPTAPFHCLPTLLLHLTTGTFHFFHGSFSQFPSRIPFPIPRRHRGFISLIAPSSSPPVRRTPAPPQMGSQGNSQPLSPPFSLPSPPHTYASNKKRKRTAFFQKQSFSA